MRGERPKRVGILNCDVSAKRSETKRNNRNHSTDFYASAQFILIINFLFDVNWLRAKKKRFLRGRETSSLTFVSLHVQGFDSSAEDKRPPVEACNYYTLPEALASLVEGITNTDNEANGQLHFMLG
jgi:hypothetical protein